MDERSEQFREVCKDSLQVIRRLKSHCKDFDELEALLEHATGEEGGPATTRRSAC